MMKYLHFFMQKLETYLQKLNRIGEICKIVHDMSSPHVRNRVDNFAGSNPPGSYLFLKLWNDLQNTLEVRGVEKVLCMSLPQVPEGARLF